ncbi:hypothetical protein QBC46DRAFT_413049 [Diplogelasinospora grovesii]|uniref:Uncharacterized protein n=1 Tax=Diplogelasinospora grovesii TaxID=303347 RepID=A0AAN6S0M6_9PEZI|nr:hypothetical protein QBC46DRAFT_413049 [Diplogelasinospora grovesii]
MKVYRLLFELSVVKSSLAPSSATSRSMSQLPGSDITPEVEMGCGSAVAQQAANWARDHPVAAIATVGVAGGLTIVAAPMLVVAPVLGAFGFSSGGVVAGSIAAGIQSAIGNVAAGSGFATLTSAGMGGYGTVVAAGAAQGAGVATAVFSGVGAWFGGRK